MALERAFFQTDGGIHRDLSDGIRKVDRVSLRRVIETGGKDACRTARNRSGIGGSIGDRFVQRDHAVIRIDRTAGRVDRKRGGFLRADRTDGLRTPAVTELVVGKDFIRCERAFLNGGPVLVIINIRSAVVILEISVFLTQLQRPAPSG